MKLRGEGEPSDDGRYALPRKTVLDVLRRHFVKIKTGKGDLHLLERDESFFWLDLPDVIDAGMVFRLSIEYRIPVEEFYKK